MPGSSYGNPVLFGLFYVSLLSTYCMLDSIIGDGVTGVNKMPWFLAEGETDSYQTWDSEHGKFWKETGCNGPVYGVDLPSTPPPLPSPFRPSHASCQQMELPQARSPVFCVYGLSLVSPLHGSSPLPFTSILNFSSQFQMYSGPNSTFPFPAGCLANSSN